MQTKLPKNEDMKQNFVHRRKQGNLLENKLQILK